jgi:hypothetical protein
MDSRRPRGWRRLEHAALAGARRLRRAAAIVATRLGLRMARDATR